MDFNRSACVMSASLIGDLSDLIGGTSFLIKLRNRKAIVKFYQ